MRKRKLLAISTLLLALATGWSANADHEQMQQANQAYREGNFSEAIRLYEALLQAGYRSEALFYNLGNSYFRTDSLGRAVLQYERALVLDPTDADIQHNLEVVRSRLRDEHLPPPVILVVQWWNKISFSFSANVWSYGALISLWMAIGGLSLWLLGKARRYKKIGFITGVVLFSWSLLFFALANSRMQGDKGSRRGVVLEKETLLHTAPDIKSPVQDTLYEGATMQILDVIGEWHKIRLYDGAEGWLPANSFEKI